MVITSAAFQHRETIPSAYTCEGANVNPPLTFSEIPQVAKNLVLIVDDPDAPNGTFTHWLLYNMSPATLQILEDNTPETGQQGVNDFGKAGYGGPCPPSGVHRYYFKLYALTDMLTLEENPDRRMLEQAIGGKVAAAAELVGLYQKQNIGTQS